MEIFVLVIVNDNGLSQSQRLAGVFSSLNKATEAQSELISRTKTIIGTAILTVRLDQLTDSYI